MNAADTENLVVPSYPRAVAQDNSNTFQDNSRYKNDWGPWVAVACILGALSSGGVVIMAILMPEIIDARAAEKAAFAIAKAEYAERDARVAIDQVQTARIELSKRGIHIQLDDHP